MYSHVPLQSYKWVHCSTAWVHGSCEIMLHFHLQKVIFSPPPCNIIDLFFLWWLLNTRAFCYLHPKWRTCPLGYGISQKCSFSCSEISTFCPARVYAGSCLSSPEANALLKDIWSHLIDIWSLSKLFFPSSNICFCNCFCHRPSGSPCRKDLWYCTKCNGYEQLCLQTVFVSEDESSVVLYYIINDDLYPSSVFTYSS